MENIPPYTVICVGWVEKALSRAKQDGKRERKNEIHDLKLNRNDVAGLLDSANERIAQLEKEKTAFDAEVYKNGVEAGKQQGKLELVELLEKWIVTHIEDEEEEPSIRSYELKDWLKSQLKKEVRK